MSAVKLEPLAGASVEESREALKLLLETSKAINQVLDLDPLLQVVMDKVVEVTRCERAFLMLADATGELQFRCAKNFDRDQLESEDIKISRSVVAQVARTGQAVCSTNVLEDESIRNRKSVLELGLESIMCVPLICRNRTIGLLYVDSHRISAMFTETSLRVFQALADHAAIAIENARLYEMAITDEKTGLYNHSYLMRRLEQEMLRADRYSEAISLLMIDIDHFKSVNDEHGHQAGDAVLRQLSARIRRCVRGHDLPARYGGEEFAVILVEGPSDSRGYGLGPDGDRRFAGAKSLAERLRERIASEPFPLPSGVSISVTVSIGCGHFPWPDITTAGTLVELADRQLYEAKRRGRNRVVAPPPLDC